MIYQYHASLLYTGHWCRCTASCAEHMQPAIASPRSNMFWWRDWITAHTMPFIAKTSLLHQLLNAFIDIFMPWATTPSAHFPGNRLTEPSSTIAFAFDFATCTIPVRAFNCAADISHYTRHKELPSLTPLAGQRHLKCRLYASAYWHSAK